MKDVTREIMSHPDNMIAVVFLVGFFFIILFGPALMQKGQGGGGGGGDTKSEYGWIFLFLLFGLFVLLATGVIQ